MKNLLVNKLINIFYITDYTTNYYEKTANIFENLSKSIAIYQMEY